jgi:ribokinase
MMQLQVGKPGILVVGSLNMDLVTETMRVPEEGETVLGNSFKTVPGGKGANQAVAAARLGGHVRMIGSVGEDAFGDTLHDALFHDGVDVSRVGRMRDGATGVALIVVANGNNRIIVCQGANAEVSPEMLRLHEEAFEACGILLVQLEIPLPAVMEAVRLAGKHDMLVILNPAPAVPLPDSLLGEVDVLTPNETECAILAGRGAQTNGCDEPDSDSLLETASHMQVLMARGARRVVVTMGDKGVLYNRGTEIWHLGAPKVTVVDTTAAGDSFSGALAVALSEGMEMEAAVRLAVCTGSLTVTAAGAQTSLPDRARVDAFCRASDLTACPLTSPPHMDL